MVNKAAAKDGAQAAIGDIVNNSISGLIGQLCGNGTVVIHNLHINAGSGSVVDSQPAGLIAYFELSGWWQDILSEAERGAIEDAIGSEVARDRITTTSRPAHSWLRGIALRIGAVHPQLASKLRAKAAGLQTGVEIDDYWQRQFAAVRRHWLRQDFEQARIELRDIAFRMREENALPGVLQSYAALLAEFNHADPYYTDVMAVVLPIVASRPGVIQATLAKGCPEFDAEQFRHAMYYGEIIGDIKRVKQGRSYALHPATGES